MDRERVRLMQNNGAEGEGIMSNDAERELQGPTLKQFYERVGTNAQDWAVEFVKVFSGFVVTDDSRVGEVVDTGTMIGWFANYCSIVGMTKGSRLYDTVLDDADTLELWMQHLNDEGLDCSLFLLDHKKRLWTAIGEEHSEGGEAMTCWLMPVVDPLELGWGEKDKKSCDKCGMPAWSQIMHKLDEAAYPVLVMTPRPTDMQIFWRFGDKLQRRREERGELK
jgi:hypothetical protein